MNTFKIILFLVVSNLVFFLFGAEFARIVGTVVDSETDKPLVDADVIIEGTELGAVTDEKGEFAINYVPLGTYNNIVASKIDYENQTITNVIVNCYHTVLNFQLRPTINSSGAEYGTITGTVLDAETGEPLIGADVVIQGTELGAGTDENGWYTIHNVLPGQYNIIARYIGYEPVTYSYVEVRANETALLNFRLRPRIIVVTHGYEHPPMVDYRETQSIHTIEPEDIERLPVTTVDEVIELQPGVTSSEFGLHMRGGAADEMIYYIDGIATKVPYTDWQYTGISPSVVQEIEIISGGFDVEYSDANSGVVNIVTKRGGSRHRSKFFYLSDEMFSGDKLNFGYNRYDLSLGGPIPMASRFHYFVAGDFMLTDAFQEAFYKVSSPRNDYHLHGKIKYYLRNARGVITISGFKSREQYLFWSPYTEPGNDLKYFHNKPMMRNKNWIVSGILDYMLTNRTLGSLKIGISHLDRCYGNRDYEWEEENNRKWYDDYRFKAEHLISYLDKDYREEHGITVAEILIDSLQQYHAQNLKLGTQALRNSPYGIGWMFYTYGDFPIWTYWHSNGLQTRFKISHSINRHHKLKVGIDFARHDVKYYNNELAWVSSAYWEYFERTPYQITGYLQDKMDFERVIAHIGVRGDYFNPGIANEVPIVYPLQFDSIFDDSSSFKISPRIGISLWVTNNMKFRFNYGHFYQFKPEISIRLQKATMFEFGYEHQLLDDVLLGLTAYFKNSQDYYNIHGFEFILHRRMWAFWSLTMSYNLQYAEGPSSWYPGWGYYVPPPEPQPTECWLDHDERHKYTAILDFEFPYDFFLPLQNFTNSFVVQYYSGQPYTPTDLRGDTIGDINSERMSGCWNVDWKFTRRIKVGPAHLVFTGLIHNLFNTEQIVDVYNTTGMPDDHGIPDPGVGQFGYISITSTYYLPQADHNHDGIITPAEHLGEYLIARDDLYSDPTNYNGPFRIKLGAGIEF